MELKRVVVTGLGAVTPLGNSVPEYWNGLRNGVSGSELITLFNVEKFKTKFACEVKGLDISKYFDRRELRRLDRYTQLALISVEEAIQDCAVNLDNIDNSRVGVIFGSGIGGLKTFFEEISEFARGDGTPRFSPFFIPKMIADIASGHISMKYKFRGPNFGIVSACATSTNTIIDAATYIRLGKADMFVTGGSEASINEVGIGGFNAMMVSLLEKAVVL